MTLREFIDAAYALLVEMNLRAAQGLDMLTVVDKTMAWAEGEPSSSPAPAAVDNDASLAQLKSMLTGTGRFV